MKPTRVATAFAALVPIAAATAQQSAPVPAGYYVVSAAAEVRKPQALGGLWLVHPRRDQIAAIGNLPSPLIAGASSVLHRASDGSLVVGHLDVQGQPIDVYVVRLVKLPNGYAYDPSSSSSIALGLATGFFPGKPMGVQDMAWLPDGNLLGLVANVGGGPVNGEVLVHVDLTSSTVTPLDAFGMPQEYPLALAHDPGSGLAFVSLAGDPSGSVAPEIWAGNPFDGSPWRSLATLPADAHGLQIQLGRLFALCETAPPVLLEIAIDPARWGQVLKSALLRGFGTDALCAEPTTGGWTSVDNSIPGTPTVTHVDMHMNISTIANSSPGTWGILTGIVWNQTPIVYGAPSPVPGPEYRWDLWPDPDLLPLAGNMQFHLRVQRTDGEIHPGVWFACDGRADPPIPLPPLGLELLLGGSVLVPGGVVPLDGSPIPLPIPNSAALIGVGICLQSLHLDPSAAMQWAMSEGAEFTIL